jgi:phage-related protein
MLPILGVLAAGVAAMLVVGGVVYLLYQAWSTNFLGIRDVVTQIWAAIVPVFDRVKAWLQVFIPAALQTLQNIWAMDWAAIQAIFNAIWPIITAIFDAFRAAFEGNWYEFGVKLREAWDKAWQLIKQILTDAWDALKTTVSNLITDIVNVFTTTDWGALGKSIIDGIIDGIKKAATSLADAAKGAAKGALDAVTGFIRGHSPSQLFEEKVGNSMMAGWIRGIERMTPQLEMAVVGASSRATAASVTNYYNLTVQSVRSAEQLERDFWLMRG